MEFKKNAPKQRITLISAILEAMKEKNISRKQLTILLEIDKSTLSKYLSGNASFPMKHFESLLDILDLKICSK